MQMMLPLFIKVQSPGPGEDLVVCYFETEMPTLKAFHMQIISMWCIGRFETESRGCPNSFRTWLFITTSMIKLPGVMEEKLCGKNKSFGEPYGKRDLVSHIAQSTSTTWNPGYMNIFGVYLLSSFCACEKFLQKLTNILPQLRNRLKVKLMTLG